MLHVAEFSQRMHLDLLIEMVTAFRPKKQTAGQGSFEERLRLLPDSLAVHEEWRKLLVVYNVSAVQVTMRVCWRQCEFVVSNAF